MSRSPVFLSQQTVTLSVELCNAILSILSRQPYAEVAQVMDGIKAELAPQNTPAPEESAAEPSTPTE